MRGQEKTDEHRAKLSQAAKLAHAKRKAAKLSAHKFDEFISSTIDAIRVSNNHAADGILKSLVLQAVSKGFDMALATTILQTPDEKDHFAAYERIVQSWE